ncbi:MAG: hypothetical protein ACT4OZ_16375 [Gemmatimonadota bacterium]
MTTLRLTRRITRRALVAVGAAGLLACNLDVNNPSVIDASQFDPSSDAALISLSAQTQFYQAFQSVARYGGLFAEEQLSGAARTEVADIGRRNFFSGNQDINIGFFGPLSRSIASNKTVLTALAGGTGPGLSLNVGRAQMNLAFSLELMAETFCQGVILGGPALTPTQLLDSSITYFNLAIGSAAAATGAEAVKIGNASRIGVARALLQKGDNAGAATAATAALATAPASFVYSLPTLDDPANRPLGNQIYTTTVAIKLDVVPDPYRALNDPRVPWADAGTKAQDGTLQDYQQRKYTAYASPLRIASYLQAQYIQAEARLKTGDPAPALTLIAVRRIAGGQGVFSGTGTPTILAELMNQAARDFWIEAKKLGDWRRNGSAVPFISPAGAPYKAALTFGSLTSIPLPLEETSTNPNKLGACP